MLKLEHHDNYYIGHYLSELLPTIPNPIVFEIGAPGDTTGDIYNKLQTGCKYYAFEADPRNFVPLCEFRGEGFFPLNIAVGATCGETTLYMSGGLHPENGTDWHLSSSIRKPKLHLDAHPWCNFDQQKTIPITTLDVFCRANDIDHIDFIWCDIQGAERDMISGAKKILDNTYYMFIECDKQEYYEGQMVKDELLNSLPQFEIIHDYDTDVLLRNKNV